MKLHLDLMHYWHVGTGSGRGGHLDAVVRRDELGLPLVPGRSLKGLLRDAVCKAHALGWYGDAEDPSTLLFGSSSQAVSEGRSVPGTLRVSDARLPSALRDAIAARSDKERGVLVSAFYREMFSTAIDEHSGVAREHSLRGIEVAVPCELIADLEALEPATESRWAETVRTALPLLRAVGGHRTRGYGRVRVMLEDAA